MKRESRKEVEVRKGRNIRKEKGEGKKEMYFFSPPFLFSRRPSLCVLCADILP
jgi:hypothetical protein